MPKITLKQKLQCEREKLMLTLLKKDLEPNMRSIYEQSLQSINDIIAICVERNRF